MDTKRTGFGADALTGLELRGVSKSYGATEVLSRFSLSVPSGTLCSLLGPSGCGKTTALRIVVGLLEPDEGRVVLHGRDITDLPPKERNLGMVFQNYALFPHLDVFENIAYGLRRRRFSERRVREEVGKALELVRLDGYDRRAVAELSGGQQQRVALARALVINPEMLLLDEPLSNLDARLRADLRDDLRRIVDELRITTLFVTHDQEEAMSVADIVAVVRDGRLEQAGAPRELYDLPATSFVADFLGRVNLIPAALSADALSLLNRSLPRPVTALPDGPVLCALRPEKIALAPPEEEGLRGVVRKSTFLGPAIRFIIDAGAERPLVVEQSAASARTASPGERVSLRFFPEDLRLFGETYPEAAPTQKEATP